MRRIRIALLILLCSAATARATQPAGQTASQARRPNVVFILADDLGWGDLSAYGHERLKTPHLDRLAAGGTLFTQFYVNGSVCSPSRAAFFTGQYPARHRIHGHYAVREMNEARGMSHWLEPTVPNVAALLKGAGYRTAHIGKWHLGNDAGGPSPREYGFDFVGTGETGGASVRQEDPYFRARSSALFVDEALRFIGEDKETPFYVQLWMLVPHATLNPTPEQLKPFARFSPSAPYPGAEAIYYASVADLDAQVGRLVAELDRRGLAENTLIIFSSDNGPEDIHVANASHSGVGSAGPFRGRKRSLYEGGVRVPFIVRWPGRVPAGRVNDVSVVAGVDLLPTLLKFAGVAAPAAHALDGEDASDVLTGRARGRAQPLFWEWRFPVIGDHLHRSPMLAVREGKWKLLLNPDRSRVELYDIPADPAQMNNLAARHPGVVARLSKQALAWQATLPRGPVAPAAGKNDYPWPKETGAHSRTDDGGARRKNVATKPSGHKPVSRTAVKEH
jgi:arylsulfatase A-like enzyme